MNIIVNHIVGNISNQSTSKQQIGVEQFMATQRVDEVEWLINHRCQDGCWDRREDQSVLIKRNLKTPVKRTSA